jgi:hypothetical protein
MNGEPGDAFPDSAFCDSAFATAPAVVNNVQKRRFSCLRGARDDIQFSQLQFDITALTFV